MDNHNNTPSINTAATMNMSSGIISSGTAAASNPTMAVNRNDGTDEVQSGMVSQNNNEQQQQQQKPTAPQQQQPQNEEGQDFKLTDESVISYLKKRGLNVAALELERHIDDESKQRRRLHKQQQQQEEEEDESDEEDQDEMEVQENAEEKEKRDLATMELDDARIKNQRSLLAMSTGGGLGYDLDSAPSIALWGGSHTNTNDTNPSLGDGDHQSKEEARRFVEGFTALQTWILSLPDDELPPLSVLASKAKNQQNNPPSATPESVLRHAEKAAASASTQNGETDPKKETELDPSEKTAKQSSNNNKISNSDDNDANLFSRAASLLPASGKTELQSVAFALLVHVYCDLLECGLEAMASAFLRTYRHVHEPSRHDALRQLSIIATTDDIVKLNANITSHSEAASIARTIRSQIHAVKRKQAASSSSSTTTATQLAAMEEKYQEANRRVRKALSKLSLAPFIHRVRSVKWQIGLSSRSYSMLLEFLARRSDDIWALAALLHNRCHVYAERREPLPYVPAVVLAEDGEQPDDDDDDSGDDADSNESASEDKPKAKSRKNIAHEQQEDVRWAAPVHPVTRVMEAGEDPSDIKSILAVKEQLPFPKFHLDAEYDNETSAAEDKKRVEFNRALLMNGFRRLEALELRREYEVGMRRSEKKKPKSHKRKLADATDSGQDDDPMSLEGKDDDDDASMVQANPRSPSILLSTLCSSSSSSQWRSSVPTVPQSSVSSNHSRAFEESGLGIVCASICPPDGRRIAAGCDDSAVRIWTLDFSGEDQSSSSFSETNNKKITSDHPHPPTESSVVLLGHKDGYPVFDVDWNRDGRTLLSAGGDGTVRLWDCMAVGPYGRLANVVRRAPPSAHHAGGASSSTIGSSSSTKGDTPSSASDLSVPGARPEPMVEVSGAALAVYRGHSPSTPVWGVSFAPSGYYFASAGSDATARLWTTDRPKPVRILVGHMTAGVNCVEWHPNCNYVLTGGDDGTSRMWDVQTGRCVRILTGSRSGGVTIVRVCPSGRYAAGADEAGIIHLWDLGSGRKVNEFHIPSSGGSSSDANTAQTGSSSTTTTTASSLSTTTPTAMIHAMSYSACGTALATGGDDCTVRVWDVRGAASHMSNRDYAASRGYDGGASSLTFRRSTLGERFWRYRREPIGSFRTLQTVLLDLKYTKRNLLLSVGKYATSASSMITMAAPVVV